LLSVTPPPALLSMRESLTSRSFLFPARSASTNILIITKLT